MTSFKDVTFVEAWHFPSLLAEPKGQARTRNCCTCSWPLMTSHCGDFQRNSSFLWSQFHQHLMNCFFTWKYYVYVLIVCVCIFSPKKYWHGKKQVWNVDEINACSQFHKRLLHRFPFNKKLQSHTVCTKGLHQHWHWFQFNVFDVKKMNIETQCDVNVFQNFYIEFDSMFSMLQFLSTFSNSPEKANIKSHVRFSIFD